MRILWLKTELLHPLDKGGKIRTYNMLRELKRDHRITYLTLDDGNAGDEARAQASEFCDELVCIPHPQQEKFTSAFYLELGLNLFSPLPYAIQKYKSQRMRAEIKARLHHDEFDVLVCDFLTPAVNVPSRLPTPGVLFQHNVEAMIWKRHHEVQANPIKKAYLYGQWVKIRRFEAQMCRRFDSVVAVSRDDRETLRTEYGVTSVFDVPTGVDIEFFRPSGNETQDLHNVVFTGSMDWLPNEDAIRYFAEQIMPLVKQSVPDLTLTVVGRNPFPGLIELSKRDSSIIVTGRVEDVRPYIERAAVYVVPLRIGGGTRLKIYEAMAMGKPIVSTTIGAEGLPVQDGEHLLLADAPEDFANALIRFLEDKSLAEKVGNQAALLVRRQFGWDRAAEKLAEACEHALSRRESRSRDLLGKEGPLHI